MAITDSEHNEIQDLGSLHHYRTEIPNIIFQLKLNPWVFKAYCVFKMTAGDKGRCFKSNSTLAEEIGCSVPTLIKLKKKLEEEGLIIVKKRQHETGGDMPDLIQIVDLWSQNMHIMSNLCPRNAEKDIKIGKNTNSNFNEGSKRDLGGGVNAVKGGSKRRLHKQDHNEQEKNKQQQEAAAPIKNIIYSCLDNLDLTEEEKIQTTRRHEEESILEAVKLALSKKEPLRSLAAFINWAAYNDIKCPISTEDRVKNNRNYAKELENTLVAPNGIMMNALHKYVEIIFTTCQAPATTIDYEKSCFKHDLDEKLNKFGFKEKK